MMGAACHMAHLGRLLVEQERFDGALALDLDRSTRPNGEAGRRKLSGYARRDLDLARQPVGLHPAGHVHGVPPQVVMNLRRPMTPATTGPESIPIRTVSHR